MSSPHPRKLIRAAVQALLVGKTAVGSKIFKSRYDPIWETELPCICIYGESEPAEMRDVSPRELKRTLNLTILIAVKGSDYSDDALDDIAADVEDAMDQDDTLGSTASESVLTNTDISIDVEGAQDVGFMRLSYQVVYVKDANAADPDKNFETATFTIDSDTADDDEGEIDGIVTFET